MSQPAASGYALGFDVGTRTIGVAIAHRATGMARALTTLSNGGQVFDWNRLDALVREWQPDTLIVGLPLALDGSEQPMTQVARDFGRRLGKRYQRPVEEVDERYTSKEAARRFAAQRASGAARRKHGAEVDALAAQIILENWISLTNTDTP